MMFSGEPRYPGQIYLSLLCYDKESQAILKKSYRNMLNHEFDPKIGRIPIIFDLGKQDSYPAFLNKSLFDYYKKITKLFMALTLLALRIKVPHRRDYLAGGPAELYCEVKFNEQYNSYRLGITKEPPPGVLLYSIVKLEGSNNLVICWWRQPLKTEMVKKVSDETIIIRHPAVEEIESKLKRQTLEMILDEFDIKGINPHLYEILINPRIKQTARFQRIKLRDIKE